MAITWAAVVAVAPELSVVSVGTQTALLAMVATMLPNPNALGSQYDIACTWLAAHLGTVSLRGGTGPSGPVTAEKIDTVSRSYAAPSSAGDGLSSTSYGQLYQTIVKNNVNTRLVLL